MKWAEGPYKEWNAMELTLNRNSLSCYDAVLETTVFHEETMEMIVPDACPDILRIVDTAGMVCVKDKGTQEGRAEITGTARCSVLYLPEGESGRRRIEPNIPCICTTDGLLCGGRPQSTGGRHPSHQPQKSGGAGQSGH